ncbi:MAG: TPM domain-containing protein [Gammaproteobacteria bacterium]|nr:TPM domain-containing protein [Gammaproteobacteria bacterium]MBU6510058.1 TPM domain-containing protein [Gammaproteobacteria bacterium]MDE2109254.1 TPM domain-containing protein [Gammaproteobacteria bacterium]MDE2461327.1 TPM domain-containing protein [Gammaproteobacteria bacterium]
MIKFSDADKARITAAIHAAEKNTSGEFVAVVARASDHYIFLPLLWAAIAALILPGILYLVSAPLAWVHIYQIQLALFVVLALLFLFVPELHLHLVPNHVKHSRASRQAKAQFYLQGVHVTRHHSGVLFFVSLAEHHVEIVADKGIHEKLGEAHWRGIIQAFVAEVRKGRVVDGFVDAIGACGAAMAKHYPADPNQPNELSDGLIEI